MKNDITYTVHYIRFLLDAHILNPLWHSSEKRRKKRNRLLQKLKMNYLERYIPFIASLRPQEVTTDDNSSEKLFSIWFQGLDNAPLIVKRCFESQKEFAPFEPVILDENSVFNYITLPSHIMDKWHAGKISKAHFSDICRVELLYRYGGLWMDATDLMISPVPDQILKEDFFVYMAGEDILGAYSFIQNCFIRARRHNPLIQMWRDLIFEYWRREEEVKDYVIHHLLFKSLVENNTIAGKLFDMMPKIIQNPTHTIWFILKDEPFDASEYQRLSQAACFQKTDYLSQAASNPRPGSYAYHILNKTL